MMMMIWKSYGQGKRLRMEEPISPIVRYMKGDHVEENTVMLVAVKERTRPMGKGCRKEGRSLLSTRKGCYQA